MDKRTVSYGIEVVLPVELEIPSLRVVLENQVNEIEWVQARYNELALLEEKRLKAAYHHQVYQKRIARAFNQKVKTRGIRENDIVLKEIREPSRDPRGKFGQKWTGPYIVKEIDTGGAAILTYLDGQLLHSPVNLDRLKKYYQ